MDGSGFTIKPITNVSSGGDVVLKDIKITDSKQGAFYISTGGISKTELNRVYVSESSSPVISIGEGSTSEIEINNSTIENNIGEGGGSISGAISSKFYLGNLDINNSIFRNNTNNSVHTGVIGGGGGAMSMHYLKGTINIKDSIFDGNQTSGERDPKNTAKTYDGGALYIFDGRDGAEVNIEGTTFSNNIAYDDGGAIMFQGTGSPGLTTNIKNSTFFKNKAFGLNGADVSGGAIQYFKNGGSSRMTNNITSTSFIGNEGGGHELSTNNQAGGAITHSGARIFATATTNRLNTLFVDNKVYNSGKLNEDSINKDVSLYKTVEKEKNVLNVQSGSNPEYTNKDILGVDIPELADNNSDIKAGIDGETVQTVIIKPGSIADNTFTGNDIPTVDQRAHNRYKDQGAVEISSIIYNANGGKYNLEDLDKYDGTIYYKRNEDGEIVDYYTVGSIDKDTKIQDGVDLKIENDDKIFLGWSKDKDATTPDEKYNIGNNITYEDENIRLYAVWKTQTYDLAVKKIDKNGNKLNGAKFKLYKEEKDQINKTLKENNDKLSEKEEDLKNGIDAIESGMVQVTPEIREEIDNAKAEITTLKETIEELEKDIKNKETRLEELEESKKDKEYEFVLFNEFETTTNGVAYIDGLEKGKYIIKEIEAPKGYELDGTEYEFDFPDTKEISILNKKIGGTDPEEKPNKPTEPSKPSKPSKKRPNKDKPEVIVEKPQINKELHISYLNGYPDKTIKPEGNITRAEVAAIFARLKLNQEDIEYNTDSKYKDEKTTDWYAKYLNFVTDNNIMQGYEDGSFKPNEKITRAEFATVVSRFGNVIDGSSDFEDIKGHWAEKNINAAQQVKVGLMDILMEHINQRKI